MPVVVLSVHGDVDESEPHFAMLREAGFEIRPQRDERMSRGLSGAAEFSEALRGAAAILAWGERYTDEVLANCPDLRVIARRGVGYDRVDMAAASARGVVVAITPNANHEAVAEHTLALMLAVTKSIVLGDRDTRAGLWPRRRITPLRGSTLGIVGLGRIGRSTAERALAMRMRVIASDPYADPDYAARQGIERVSLDELLARADIVSVHCPLSDETRGMIDKDALAAMKPDAVLINTARGAIVVEEDLAEAARVGPTGRGRDRRLRNGASRRRQSAVRTRQRGGKRAHRGRRLAGFARHGHRGRPSRHRSLQQPLAGRRGPKQRAERPLDVVSRSWRPMPDRPRRRRRA